MSLPIRIALVGAMAFLAVWMVALKPKAAAEEPVTPAPVAAAPATPAEPVSPAPATPAAPAPAAPAPATPATAAAKPKSAVPAPKPKPVTVVALVGTGVDDALARELVGDLDGVPTRVIPIEEIGRHKDLIGSVDIRQTPTILVIGADRRAQRIEGLPDAAQLARALSAASR